MDRRVRLTPEEILDLMSPSPCAVTPWLKPIDGYGRRADLQQLEIALQVRLTLARVGSGACFRWAARRRELALAAREKG